ncbi:hypothetical protein D9M70_606390 [compost metagenome]
MHGVDVGHHQIDALGAEPTSLVGLAHQTAVVVVPYRAEHDHAGAQAELGVGDAAVVLRHHQVLDEAEGIAQPGDGGGGIAVAQAGNHVGTGHGGDLLNSGKRMVSA